MKAIELLVVGSSPELELCEDAVVVTEDFIAVIDGTTDKTGWSYQGVSGGRLAANQLAEVIRDLPADTTAGATVDRLSSAIRQTATNSPADGPSAAVAVFSRQRREVWQVGDVSFAELGDRDLRPRANKEIDAVAAGYRAALTQALLNGGYSQEELLEEDPGRQAILPLLSEQYRLRNRIGRWTFGAIDGQPVPEEHLHIWKLAADVDEIVMYSDGYPGPFRTLEEAEAELQRLLAMDPLCIGPLMGTKGIQPGNVSYDDRAYVKIGGLATGSRVA